jgi:hypothetical protein
MLKYTFTFYKKVSRIYYSLELIYLKLDDNFCSCKCLFDIKIKYFHLDFKNLISFIFPSLLFLNQQAVFRPKTCKFMRKFSLQLLLMKFYDKMVCESCIICKLEICKWFK